MNKRILRHDEALIRKLEHKFRKTSRQLIQMETEEETLHYLVETLQTNLSSDFVGIVLMNNEQYEPRIWSGQVDSLISRFPLQIDHCTSMLTEKSMYKDEYVDEMHCAFHRLMDDVEMKMWFTVPLVHRETAYGFCVIGFLEYVELLEMEHIFNEFGKDVALAINLIRDKSTEHSVIAGIEWITNNLSLTNPLEETFEQLTVRAARATRSVFSSIYMYNELEHSYDLQRPMYGDEQIPTRIHEDEVERYFPSLERAGTHELSVPIMIDDNMLGILYLSRSVERSIYNQDDLQLAQLLSNHIAVLLKNAQHFKIEREQRERLQKLLHYQQKLVKETIIHDEFHGVTQMLEQFYERPVILFDRFLRVLSFEESNEQASVELFVEKVKEYSFAKNVFQIYLPSGFVFSVWPIYGVRHLLGYLAVGLNEQRFDEFDQLTIELAINICSIQFIKKKLVFDANEQVKDTFLAKLLIDHVTDEKSIIQYANLFDWDIYAPHRVAQLTIELNNESQLNLLEKQARQMFIWEQITADVQLTHPDILMSTFNDEFLLIVPIEAEEKNGFWRQLFNQLTAIAKKVDKSELFLGIGNKVTQIKDYVLSYRQALQASNIVESRFRDLGYALFENLGSYTVLHDLDQGMSSLFVNDQLEELFVYSREKNIDLWKTLRTFLQNNGNVKATAEQLYIHRSSLIYRLDKIEELLGKELNNADDRFDLMMAVKLVEMQGRHIQ